MQIVIAIERVAYGGEGIGFLEGKVCFIEGALPGEKVRVKVMQDKKKFLRGRAIEILNASPARIAPPCAVYSECGGCQYQHVEYAEELRWKEIQVREYLQKNLKIDPALVLPIVGSSKPYEYRTSLTLHRGKQFVGFFGRDNETVIPISKCLLAAPELQKSFSNPGTYRIASDHKIHSSDEDAFFEMRVGSESILTHSKSFFQSNLEITEKIGTQIRKWTEESKPEIFMDLYAGSGTFTMLAGHRTPRQLCIEENPYSLKALEKNLAARNLKAEVLAGTVEKILPRWIRENKTEKAFVFLDPPRKGMAEPVARLLSENLAGDLAYLSCHLGTLTRDLGLILTPGHWNVLQVIPFDMFPRTKHIEVLVLLKRRS